MDKIPLLLEVLPYIQSFKDKTFVIKIGGSVIDDEENLMSLCKDISVLYNIGIKVVLVHGGAVQADRYLEKIDHKVQKIAGRRITDEICLDAAKMVYGGKLNSEITSTFASIDVPSVGLKGGDGGTVLVEKREPKEMVDPDDGRRKEVDFGYVGDIVGIDTHLIEILLKDGFLPVISSLAVDKEGGVLNVNADTIAKELAGALRAEKLIILTDVPGVLEDEKNPTTVISYLTISKVKELFENGAVSGGMRPKLHNCMSAVDDGVNRVHIIDGTREHSLLVELFTNQGIGTMIE